LGADLLPDGELNNVGQILTSLLGLAPANPDVAGRAVGVASSTAFARISGGVFLAILLYKANKAMIGYMLKKIEKMSDISKKVKENMLADMREKFDQQFKTIREMIYERLREYYGISDYSGSYLSNKHLINLTKERGKDLDILIRENQ